MDTEYEDILRRPEDTTDETLYENQDQHPGPNSKEYDRNNVSDKLAYTLFCRAL